MRPYVEAFTSVTMNLQVTAEHPGAPRRCTIANWSISGPTQDVLVMCVDHTNTLTNSGFNLSYHRERAAFGAVDLPSRFAYLWTAALDGPSTFTSRGGASTVGATGPGLNLMQFDLVGARETHVQVTAYGTTPDRCSCSEAGTCSAPPWWCATSSASTAPECRPITGTSSPTAPLRRRGRGPYRRQHRRPRAGAHPARAGAPFPVSRPRRPGPVRAAAVDTRHIGQRDCDDQLIAVSISSQPLPLGGVVS